MKKLILAFALIVGMTVSAQTEKGKFVVETAVLSNEAPSTGLGYSKVGDLSTFNVGLNGGYFVADNLALKAGAGYSNASYDGETLVDGFTYRVGAEYYIAGYFPVEVALTGSALGSGVEDPMYVSTQVGYSWFFNDNVSMKPLVRYNFSTKDEYSDVLSFGIGFGFHF